LVHIFLDVGAQPQLYYGYEYVREEAFVDATMWMLIWSFDVLRLLTFKMEV
jgi:hypothetical protein